MMRFSGQRIDPLSLAAARQLPAGELKDLYFFVYKDGKLKLATVKIPTNLEAIAEPFHRPFGEMSAKLTEGVRT